MSLFLRFIFISFGIICSAAVGATTAEIRVDQMMEPSFGILSGADFGLKGVKSLNGVSPSSASIASVAGRKQPVLLIRVSFTDQEFTYSREDFRRLLFSTDINDASVANYYLENSYQDYLLQPADEFEGNRGDGVIDIQLPYEHPSFGANYGAKSASLVRDAIAQADRYIDFKQYDNNHDRRLDSSELAIVLMVAGYENAYGGSSAPKPNVWAHKADLAASFDGIGLTAYAMFGERHQNHLATIGIISHEMGHLLFSLPDLYDRQWDSNGIGRWGLMGLGSWNSQGGYSGSSPAHLMAWSKVKAGFLKPKDVTGNELSFNLSSTSEGPDAMRIWLDPFRHGEHFLLEYRTKTSLDKGLPGHGLLISHVDDWVGYGNGGPQNDVAEHKLVDIEEADGRQDLDQLQNLGDRLDVYNDAYGQDYFGSSSLPASSDYHGNSSGVEISSIKVGDRVSGLVALPYQNLGDNLGYDDGGIGSAWGENSGVSTSLIEIELGGRSWIHGVDVFSHGQGFFDVSLYANFNSGVLSNKLLSVQQQEITPGWNRVSFEHAISAEDLNRVFLRLESNMSVGRAFSIDTDGKVSGKSYALANLGFEKVNFDFNQRLLVADQQEAFDYQVPKKVDYSFLENTGGGGSFAFGTSAGFLGLLFVFAFGLKAREKLVR